MAHMRWNRQSNVWPEETTTAELKDLSSWVADPVLPPDDAVNDSILSSKTNDKVSIIDFPILPLLVRYPSEETKDIIDTLASVLKSNSSLKILG